MAGIKKKALGKGLNALFSENEQNILDKELTVSKSTDSASENEAENRVIYLDINRVTPNRKQPRKAFNDESIDELAESIRSHGVIQPLIVKTIANGYEIIAGERRWRASRKVGLKEVPCIIKTLTDKDNLLVALIENLQREDLNAIDESSAYCSMMEDFSMTQDEISKNVGKSRPYIANSVRLQKLPDSIRSMIASGDISAGHGRALLSIDGADKQLELAQNIADNQLSVRQTEQLVKTLSDASSNASKKTKVESDNRFKTIESDIKNSIGTKVKIKEKNNRGTIQLSFYSREELERLIELLTTIK